MDKTEIKSFNEIEYKIYGYTLPEVPTHDGYVKIGDTTRDAVTRVFEQVGTAGLNPDILFEKLARKSDGTWFRDKELHRYLMLQGIEKKDFNNRADEWFYFNGYLEKAEQYTDQFINQDYDESQINDDESSYMLRNEQQQAVEKTYEYYKSGVEPKEFLWNAKPRFGKTLTTYDFIRNLNVTNVLIVTNRPAIANSWYDDFHKFIAWQEPHIKFVSETEALSGKAMTRDEYRQFIETTSYENPAQITFISLQDLKGARFAGGSYDKLEWVPGLNWDLLVIDEAHEGVDTVKTDIAFSQIKRKFTLHLSGTPFKALADNKFSEEQIFNWSYVDEQEAKQNWDPLIGSNPYESLPTLNLFTYQMSKMVEEEVSEGLPIEEDINVDYAFDLNEFFRVKDNGRFEYEESVMMFLNNLTSGKFPFAKDEYRNELNHTFWLLPRVNAAKALEKLLQKHPIFKEYKIILAAGDGISLAEDIEVEALNYKENARSFDRVKKAIKNNEKTITLSVGQLTTGVTIPEWTAVLMLNNIKSPSLYFQAAFRAQNPYEYNNNGKRYRKENAYIFDFSPDRTLVLYDELANNLTGQISHTTSERKNKIEKLLNFFPVIAEDEKGVMHEIDASEVMTIPTRITSREVVKRGFMSNLLFANISGIFSGDSPFKEILNKIPPEKDKRLEKPREVNVTDPHINEEGDIDIPSEVVIGRAGDLFGEKIYVPETNTENLMTSLDSIGEPEHQDGIKNLAKQITDSFSAGFNNLQDNYRLNKGQTNQIKQDFHTTLENTIEEKSLTTAQQIKELKEEFELQTEEAEKADDKEQFEQISSDYENRKKAVEKTFVEELNKEVKETINDVVEEQIEKVEERKKKTTEDDVRDHLRGFSRTIPSFLMAYGDDNTKLANFEENIDPATFKDLTSITIDEFKKLRDGFEYISEEGKTKEVSGLFNEVVFNASIKEFMETKNRLANYFDDSLEEDIFYYIPPQQTNQIFTPKLVVKKMVDALEKENPHIFSDRTIKFADLYAKSGLYITEVVKKLNNGLKEEIPNQEERIKWILENQVYVCAPNNIIYNIVKNFIFSNMTNISTSNLIEIDTMQLASEGRLASDINKIFGDDNLKFDVIIGNPPYQDKTIGDNKTYAPPIYHKFLDESYKLADKVLMIHPARFLFNAGSTPKAWNRKMLSDEHLKVVYYNDRSTAVFPNTDIKGGIAITYRDKEKEFGAIETFIAYEELKDILKKIKKHRFSPFSELVHAPESYRFTDQLHKDYDNVKGLLSRGHEYAVMTNIFSKLPFVFLDTKTKSDEDFYRFYGRENNRRVYKWIKSKYIESHPNLLKYKVFLAKSNGSGTFGETLTEPVVGVPNEGHTQTFISIGKFDTKAESIAVTKYIKTKFLRALLGTLKVTQDNKKASWSNIPCQNFTKYSDIDWSKSISEIDQQLYKKYNLTSEEIKFIEENVRAME